MHQRPLEVLGERRCGAEVFIFKASCVMKLLSRMRNGLLPCLLTVVPILLCLNTLQICRMQKQ